MTEVVRLTVLLEEQAVVGGRPASDALLAQLAAGGVRTAALVRATLGFGSHHDLLTASLETAALNLPLMLVAVDDPQRVDAVLEGVLATLPGGLIVQERGVAARAGEPLPPTAAGEEVKVSLLVGRRERALGRPAATAVVDAFHAAGVGAAVAVLGVDGILAGRRERARFWSANAGPPTAVIGVGRRDAVAAGITAARTLVDAPALVERVTVLGAGEGRLSPPPPSPDHDPGGRALWQKLTVWSDGSGEHGRHDSVEDLVRRLRRAGVAGATVVRAAWGYAGGGEPHGDRLPALRRRTPTMAIVMDRPSRIGAAWRQLGALTGPGRLITSEVVPALHVATPAGGGGSLRRALPRA